MEYRGYHGDVEFDDSANIFHGWVIDTKDVITFEGESVAELQTAFRESIDDYLDFCRQRGEEPEKPFSGQIVTRIPLELFREVSAAARENGTTLDAWLTAALWDSLKKGVGAKGGSIVSDEVNRALHLSDSA